MKKITLLAALFAGFAMSSQVTIWEEDFESYTAGNNVGEVIDVPSDYLNYDVNADTFGWGLSNPVNFTQPFGDIYTGNFIISASYITIGANGNGGQGAITADNILVLPMLSIPSSASGVNLTYYVGSGTDPDFFSETYAVTVTTSSAEADILAATPILSTTLAFQGGEEVTLSLDDYIGQDVYISFRHFNTTDEWLIGLDNISVTASTLGVSDQTFKGFNYYVANNQLNLSANTPMEKVALYNMLGQQVVSQKLNSSNETINLSGLQTGVYIATISIDGASKSFKIVKN